MKSKDIKSMLSFTGMVVLRYFDKRKAIQTINNFTCWCTRNNRSGLYLTELIGTLDFEDKPVFYVTIRKKDFVTAENSRWQSDFEIMFLKQRIWSIQFSDKEQAIKWINSFFRWCTTVKKVGLHSSELLSAINKHDEIVWFCTVKEKDFEEVKP